jgi:hypothetical protein
MNRTTDTREVVCHELIVGARPPVEAQAATVVLLVHPQEAFLERYQQEILRQWSDQRSGEEPYVVVAFERAARREMLRALWWSPGEEWSPVHRITLIGTGMWRWELTAQEEHTDTAPPGTADDRWSRLRGALGDVVWQRFRTLRFAIVGVGRSGSVMATSLARSGVTRLTLIDPDRVEGHNLDAMVGVTRGDIGRLKVEAVADTCAILSGSAAEIETVAESISGMHAFRRAKAADILASCVDHDGARVAAAMVATAFCKPFLDVGTGIFLDRQGQEMGADIRLILPGRCLLCFGGVANRDQALALFTRGLTEQQAARQWFADRAGSLESLNQIAVHHGILLMHGLVAETVQRSTWRHLEFDRHGVPVLQDIEPPQATDCPLCRLSARGDAALAEFPLLHQVFRRG